MKARHVLASAGAVALSIAGLATGGVQAQALTTGAGPGEPVGSTFVDAKGIVHYPFDPTDLPGFVVVTEKGDSVGDACTFSGAGSGSASEPTRVRMTELTFQPDDCSRTMAVATYPVATTPASADRRPAGDEQTSSAVAADVTDASTAAVNYYGFLKVNVEDAAQINVTYTKSTISWAATSSCVTSSTRTAGWGWYTPSGWFRTSYSTPSNGMNCGHAYLNTVGTYMNDLFCPGDGNTTYTNHSKTLFEGKPAGQYYWSYTVSKSGGCSSALHYDYDLVHP